MKILFLVDFSLDTIGGAQKSTITYLNQIVNEYDCYVLSPKGNVREEKTKAKFLYFKKGKNSFEDFSNKFFALHKAVIEIAPHFVHAQFSQFGFVLIIYNMFWGRKKTKCIFTDRDFYDAYNRKYRTVFKLFGKYMYRIVCTTKRNADRWMTQANLNNVCVIPNVLDESWERYDSGKRVKQDKFTVGFVGRYVKYKRWDLAYEIAKRLDEKGCRFIFALSTKEWKMECDEYIEKVKTTLQDVIVLFDADEKEISNAYYKMDLFVLTSENESFGRTLIEAMSRNTAVIGSDSGGVPEVIGRKEYLFETGNAEEAIKLIEQMKADEKLLRENQAYGLNRVEEKYSLGVQKKRIMKLYKEGQYV